MKKYKKYENAYLIRDWEKLIEKDLEYVERLQEEWLEVEEYNEKISKELYKEKWDAITDIKNLLLKNGINVSKGKGYYSWFDKNVIGVINNKYGTEPSFPYAHMGEQEVHGYKIYNSQSPTTIVELYKKVKNSYLQKSKNDEQEDKLLVESIKYAASKGINIEGLTSKEIVSKVREYAVSIYEKENLDTGTEIDLKHECEYCDTYICGERRCVCGNRRISVEIEGNIVDGFYHYTEPW